MANGTLGDHPLTDILGYGVDVYSPLAADLVRQISALADEKTLRDLGDLLNREYNPYLQPDVAKLEAYLINMRDRLRQEAKDRGFEL
jgi:hypothetical protein